MNIQHADTIEPVSLSSFKVIEVVGRRDLHGFFSKLQIDQDGVTDDGNVSFCER